MYAITIRIYDRKTNYISRLVSLKSTSVLSRSRSVNIWLSSLTSVGFPCVLLAIPYMKEALSTATYGIALRKYVNIEARQVDQILWAEFSNWDFLELKLL